MLKMANQDYHHALITCTLTGEQKFCGDTHCLGKCGYPALFLRYYIPDSNLKHFEKPPYQKDDHGYYLDHKAMGSMVAYGRAWRDVPWNGERVYLELSREQANAVFDWWWK